MGSAFRPLRVASSVLTAAIAVFTFAAVTAQPVLAQDAKTVALGFSGGASFPTGRLDDGASTGYALAGHLYVNPTQFRAVRFRGDVSFDRWDVKGDAPGVEGSARVLGFVANVLYEFQGSDDSRLRPYVIGGVGAFNQKVTESYGGLSANANETNVGVQAGGGFMMTLSGFSTFLEAKYLTAYSNDSWSWIPVTVGVRF